MFVNSRKKPSFLFSRLLSSDQVCPQAVFCKRSCTYLLPRSWRGLNPTCAYYLFQQDRDHNAGLNILTEALRLIGLIDQAVNGIGLDDVRHVTWRSIAD